MSFTDQVVLWLHVAFALFTIGPLTVATMSTPRYVRARNLPVLRFLARMTRIYSVISLGVLAFGIVAAQLLGDFSRPWLSVSMTLFVVAFALLLLIMRDQHRAIVALDAAASQEADGSGPAPLPVAAGETAAAQVPGGEPAGADTAAAATTDTAGTVHLASVERGRIASMAGLTSLIWLVILALMIWQP